jgi:hypothetical protein
MKHYLTASAQIVRDRPNRIVATINPEDTAKQYRLAADRVRKTAPLQHGGGLADKVE